MHDAFFVMGIEVMDCRQLKSLFKNLLFLITFSLFFACSKSNQTVVTEVKILKGNAALSIANGAGGVVLYGKNDKGDSFGKIIDPNGAGSIQLELRNGQWEFYAFSWQGPNTFQGTVYCSYSTSNLSGTDASVAVTLANANCGDTKFSPYMNGTSPLSFPVPKVVSCSRDLTSFPPTSMANECDDTVTASNKGYFVSYKVALYGFMGQGGGMAPDGQELSTCIYDSSLTSTTGAAITLSTGGAINLPLGGGVPVPTRISAYYGTTACDISGSARGRKDFDFTYGIISAPSRQVSTYVYSGTTAGINLYLAAYDYDVCSSGRELASPFAAGLGTLGSPYVICNNTQFNNIGSTYVTNHFRLGANIDFNYGTFVPIGGTGAVATFTGNFYGDYHSIRNVTHMPAYANVGMIRQAGNGVLVNNLTFENVMIDAMGATNAGILIGDGSLANATPIMIENVDFRHTRLFAGTKVGQAIGSAQKIKINQVHVYAGHVEGNGSRVGGLVGEVNIANTGYMAIRKSDYSGDVSGYGGSDVGGIAGYMIASSDMEEVRSEGIIKGYGNVGGIVGNGLGNITNCYSLASVDASGATLYSGGIAGTFTGIMTNCFSTLGTITSMTGNYNGAIKGVGAGTITTSYYSNNGSASGGTPLTVDNLHTNSQLTGFSIGTTTATPWYKAASDDTYDYPRLSWELAEEYYLPHLKRECSGNYANTIGAGTSIDPRWVCTKNQFLAMSASPGNFILKRSIDFHQHTFGSTSAISIANFNLNGNGYMVANVGITPGALSFNGADCNFGLFGRINPGNIVQDLVLSNINYNINYASIFAAGNCWISAGNPIPLKVGILAGVNEGTVDNVSITKSKILYSVSTAAPSLTSQKDYIGGVVGVNNGAGAMITRSDVDTELALGMTVSTTSDDEINVGGVVGKNMNFASINKTDCRTRIAKFTGDLYYNTFIGGIAGQNDLSASIYEVASEGELSINPSVNPAVFFNVGGVVGFNNAALSNSFSRSRFDIGASNNLTNYIGGIVAYNAGSGTVNKAFYETGYTDNTISAVPKKGIAGGNAGIVTNSYCVETSFTPANGFNNGSGVSGSAISYTNDVSANCLLTTTPTYSYSTGLFSVTDGVLTYTYNNFNITNNWLNRYSSGAAWLYDLFNSGSPLRLIYADHH